MKKSQGFTLIELVVVMVILGILAAVALPKFVNMTGQARTAKMNGAVGAVQSSITLIHAQWLAQGSPAGATPTINAEGGVALASNNPAHLVNGYPAAEAFVIANQNLAGLDNSFTTTMNAGGDAVTIADANGPATCAFTVTESTGAGNPPLVSAVGACE